MSPKAWRVTQRELDAFMRRQTISELLFEQYLSDTGLTAEHEPAVAGRSSRLDYRLVYDGRPIDYLVRLRRLLDDLAANGHPFQKDLIRREDFPPWPHYLPKPLPPPDDQLLQQELRRTDDLAANALLLTRATGIRIGECIHLSEDIRTRWLAS